MNMMNTSITPPGAGCLRAAASHLDMTLHASELLRLGGGRCTSPSTPCASTRDAARRHGRAGRCHGRLHAGRRRLLSSRRSRSSLSPVMREVERVVLLRVVDEYWMDHIDAMQRPAPGHPPAGLCPDRPHHRLQEGVPGDVRGDDRRHPGGDGPPAVLRPR